MNLRKILIKLRDTPFATSGGLAEAARLSAFLKSCGFVRGQHRGVSPAEFDDKAELEWYIGQGINIIDSESWFAMNIWLNIIEEYVPEDYEVGANHFEEDLFVI